MDPQLHHHHRHHKEGDLEAQVVGDIKNQHLENQNGVLIKDTTNAQKQQSMAIALASMCLLFSIAAVSVTLYKSFKA